KLVIVMNVHQLAFSRSQFSDAVDYKLRIRPIDDAANLTPTSDASREQTIVCKFAGGTHLIEPNQRATCRFDLVDGSETVSFDTRTKDYKGGGSAAQNGIRVFAGVRSDTWFLDLAKTVKYNNGLPVLQTPGINGLHGLNVLSIVVEVDKNRFA